MAQSNATQTFTCALTGLSPLDDPVVAPSGYVCSRRLLLAKLAENGGVDPFDAGGAGGAPRRLDAADLVALARPDDAGAGGAGAGACVPPRPPAATSLPSLLHLLRGEFDAVLLELHDTRRALEEARRELSSALYQNDAAVRVVARVVAERDAARGRLAALAAAGGPVPVPAAPAPATAEEPSPPKRDRPAGGEGGGEDGPAKKAKVVADDDGAAPLAAAATAAPAEDRTKIPPAELAAMCAAWKALSKGRRAVAKLKRTPEATAAHEAALARLVPADGAPERRANLGKAGAKAGVLCLAGALRLGGDDAAEYVVAGGHHQTAVVYDRGAGTVAATLAGGGGSVRAVHGRALEGAGTLLVATGADDGAARLYAVRPGEEAEPARLLGSATLAGGDDVRPVAVTVHPASTAAAALVLVASSAGSVGLYRHGADEGDGGDGGDGGGGGGDGGLRLLTLLEAAAGTRFSSGCLHPDGLIYLAGTDDGRLVIWDLKTQAVAGTLEGHDGRPVDSIAVSENGYHVASASSASPDVPVHVWDLRKLKLGATVPTGDVGAVSALAFDPTATYLAYAGEGAARVCVAKDWDRVVCSLAWTKPAGKKRKGAAARAGGGLAWGGSFAAEGEDDGEGPAAGGGVWLAAGCDGQRPVRFWEAKESKEEEEKS